MLTQEGSWESSQRSLINNNTQVGSLCVGILSLLAPGTAWLTDRFGARQVQNFTLHTSNPNTAAAILPRGILFGEGLKKQRLLWSPLLANDHFRFSFASLEVSTIISLPSASICICLVLWEVGCINSNSAMDPLSNLMPMLGCSFFRLHGPPLKLWDNFETTLGSLWDDFENFFGQLYRHVCLFGAALSSVSLLLSAAAPTLPILYLTFGLLLGAGLR